MLDSLCFSQPAVAKQHFKIGGKMAALCNVSRQLISKWEADLALSELDKLLIFSESFFAVDKCKQSAYNMFTSVNKRTLTEVLYE